MYGALILNDGQYLAFLQRIESEVDQFVPVRLESPLAQEVVLAKTPQGVSHIVSFELLAGVLPRDHIGCLTWRNVVVPGRNYCRIDHQRCPDLPTGSQ